jgi:uncharacterized protein (DUF1697 family)
MSDLKLSFEDAGFTAVSTVLSSGNVVFTASGAGAVLERKAEAAMQKRLGRVFPAIVRPVEALRELLASDPYAAFRLPPDAKRIVTFLRKPAKVKLPVERDGARILCTRGTEAFIAYVRSPKGPVFMELIAKTFGDEVTTRTWDTVGKIVARAEK